MFLVYFSDIQKCTVIMFYKIFPTLLYVGTNNRNWILTNSVAFYIRPYSNGLFFLMWIIYLLPKLRFHPCLSLNSSWRNRNRWCVHSKEIRRAETACPTMYLYLCTEVKVLCEYTNKVIIKNKFCYMLIKKTPRSEYRWHWIRNVCKYKKKLKL